MLKVAGTTLAGSALYPSLLFGQEADAKSRPNVLFIAVDDLRPQLGCFGHDQMHSPNIDSLAKSGVQFDRAYCNVPVCGASRCSLMSGLRPTHERFKSYKDHVDEQADTPRTLADHFKGHGYHTVSWGIIYHHLNDDLDGWSEKPMHPRPEGLFGWQAYRTKENRELLESRGKEKKRHALAYEAADCDDAGYPDGYMADLAVKKLAELKQKDKPFFFGVGFWKPHLPFNAPRKYWDLYKRDEIDLADNPFRPKGAPDRAMHNWGELRQYANIPAKGPVSEDMARTLIHGYYACVSYTDAQVGKLLNALKKLGLEDNTIVVLWGDHGWQLGEHGLWCKHANFETSLHAPLIIRAPGIKPARTERLTEFVDIYPSLATLCDLPVPKACEGTSLVPLMKQPDRAWKSATFSMYAGGVSMRTDRYRYTEWPIQLNGPVQHRMLYDHEKDPAENTNLAVMPEHEKLVERLHEQLRAGWQKAKPT